MLNDDLHVGLVCYWQISGWHGCHVIIRMSLLFVYYKEYCDGKIENKIYRRSKKKFLVEHQIYDCEYGSYHKNIGKIISI